MKRYSLIVNQNQTLPTAKTRSRHWKTWKIRTSVPSDTIDVNKRSDYMPSSLLVIIELSVQENDSQKRHLHRRVQFQRALLHASRVQVDVVESWRKYNKHRRERSTWELITNQTDQYHVVISPRFLHATARYHGALAYKKYENVSKYKDLKGFAVHKI